MKDKVDRRANGMADESKGERREGSRRDAARKQQGELLDCLAAALSTHAFAFPCFNL